MLHPNIHEKSQKSAYLIVLIYLICLIFSFSIKKVQPLKYPCSFHLLFLEDSNLSKNNNDKEPLNRTMMNPSIYFYCRLPWKNCRFFAKNMRKKRAWIIKKFRILDIIIQRSDEKYFVIILNKKFYPQKMFCKIKQFLYISPLKEKNIRTFWLIS